MHIIQDTREQKPLEFQLKGNDLIIVQKLEHGDYSIEGMEDILCIERKASASEIANNIKEERFYRLLAEVSSYHFAVIVCEFPFSDVVNFPYISCIPNSVRKRIKVRGNYLISQIADIQATYRIPFIFCDSAKNAAKYTYAFMRKVYDNYE